MHCVAGAARDTSPSDMLGGQGLDFLRRAAFWSIRVRQTARKKERKREREKERERDREAQRGIERQRKREIQRLGKIDREPDKWIENYIGRQ